MNPDFESAAKALKLIEMMDDLDDVQEVYHNLGLTEELINQME